MRIPTIAALALASSLGRTPPASARQATTPQATAQQPASRAGRPLELVALQDAAIASDPRLATLQLQSAQSDLRVRNIGIERRPIVSVAGQAQAQSDVPTAPFSLPTGQPLFSVSKLSYDGSVRVDQRILDRTIETRTAVEEAQLAERQAQVLATLYGLRQTVSDAFFAAAAVERRAGALAATIADLEGRLREAQTRVREGAALAADAAAIEATLLERRQDDAELRASRHAALARLAKLTGQPIGDADVLMLPALAERVAGARKASETPQTRPEYIAFARTADRLGRQADAVAAQDRPVVSAVGRVGYGRPGLNFISDRFETYAVAALQVQWKAWNWGASARERDALALQQRMVAADRAAFTKTLGVAVEGDLATIDRLTGALTLDDRIIVLRDEVDRTTRRRFDEGVVTASESLGRAADLLQARFNKASHEVELAQASARYLTTLGLEVR